MHFLCETLYRLPETVSALKNRGALKVLAESLKTIFDEIHFIVNLLYQYSVKKHEEDFEH